MLTPRTVAGLMYHEVTNDPSCTGFQRASARPYTLTHGAFARHLDCIADEGLVPALVSQLDFIMSGRDLLLTFDDGGLSALYAAEALARRGWRGHFFIVTGKIGERTFLDRAGIRELASAGHLVGSHSHTHPDIFRGLTRQRMFEEWRVSRTIVSDILGAPCDTASIPGGDQSPAVLASAAEAGFNYLFTSEPWLHPRSVDGCWMLGRFAVKDSLSPAHLRRLLRFRGWRRAWMVRRLKDIARRGLGPLYPLYVRRITASPPSA